MADTVKGCATCRFSKKIRPNPQVLEDKLVCTWGPPIFQMAMTKDGQFMPGVGPTPCPHPAYFCHRFEPATNGAANDN